MANSLILPHTAFGSGTSSVGAGITKALAVKTPQKQVVTDKSSQEISNLKNQLNTLTSTINQQNQQQSSLEARINELNQVNQQQALIEDRINALNQAKQAQAVSDLGKAKDTQLSSLASEESGIRPTYDTKRNVTAATNMMGRRTLAEELAARGEAKSGVADEANIRANMSLQGETGALNTQEAADIADIARRRTGTQNAYESDVASAKAGLEAATMQNLINQYNADRQFKLQESDVTGTYGGNQTMAAQQFSQAKNQQEIDNIFRQSQTDIQNQLNNRQITNEEAQNKLDNLYRNKSQAEQVRQFDAQFNQSSEQQKLDNLYRQQTFDYAKSRDAVSDSQWQKQLNLDLRKQTFSEAQQKIESAFAQKRITQSDKERALSWARFNYEKDPSSLDNQYKKAQIDSMSGKTDTNTTSTVDDYASTINSIYVAKPSAANNYQSSINTAGIKTYIDGLIAAGVDKNTINSLSARYGIQ